MPIKRPDKIYGSRFCGNAQQGEQKAQEQKLVCTFFAGAEVEIQVDKYHQERTNQYDLSHRECLNVVGNIGSSQNRADCKIQQGDPAYNVVKPAVNSMLHTVCIKQKWDWSKEDHNEAQGAQGRGIGNEQLADFGLAQHPDRTHNHAPAKILHVKACVVHKSKHKAEKNGSQACEQEEKSHVGGKPVTAEDQLPDVGFVSTENLVHNTGIVGGVGG